RYRRAQSANADATLARGPAVEGIRLGVRRGVVGGVCLRGGAIESSVPGTVATCTRGSLPLFVYQKFFIALTFSTRAKSGDRSGGCVDCRDGESRRADTVAHRGGDVLDRGIRHHLFLPGFCI